MHTLGGIVGAVLGARRNDAPAPETLVTEAAIRVEEERKQVQRRVVLLYWLCVLIVITAACGIFLGLSPEKPLMAPILVGLFLPVGQFVASWLALAYLYLTKPPRLDECVKRLDRMTLLAFLGALFGCIGSALTLVAVAIH